MAHNTTPLAIISGRVMKNSGVASAHVEFEAHAIPSPGTLLRSASGALCEVLRPLNPTEVEVVLRSGARPAIGAVLTPDAADETEPPNDWSGSFPPETLTLFAGTPFLSALSGDTTDRPPPKRALISGLAGLDLLAPMLEGGAQAWLGDNLATLRRMFQSLLPRLRADLGETTRVLWVSGRPAPPHQTPNTLTLAPNTKTVQGGLAVTFRSAERLAVNALAAGDPLLVVLDDPGAVLRAWATCDAKLRGSGSGVLAIDHLRALLRNILTAPGPARAVVGLLPTTEVEVPLPGTHDDGLVGLFQTLAVFDGANLALLESFGGAALPEGCTDARHRQTALAVQEVLSAAQAASDYAKIFGELELSETQHEVIRVSEQLEAFLTTFDAEWPQTLRRCAEIIQGTK